MYNKVYKERSNIKVGILKETPYLPISKAVKRAIGITRKALVDAGY
jgi:hypothetical protein